MPTYHVLASIKIDHPELRGPSYAEVAPGTSSPFNHLGLSHRAAVALYEDIRAGAYDFGSEFVREVWVVRETAHALGYRHACVRRKVIRDRVVAGGREVEEVGARPH